MRVSDNYFLLSAVIIKSLKKTTTHHYTLGMFVLNTHVQRSQRYGFLVSNACQHKPATWARAYSAKVIISFLVIEEPLYCPRPPGLPRSLQGQIHQVNQLSQHSS